MVSEAEILPQRRRTRPGGRHRGAQSPLLPPGFPAVVLAVAAPVATGGSPVDRMARELASLIGTGHGVGDVRVGYLGDVSGRHGDLDAVVEGALRVPHRPAGTRREAPPDPDDGSREAPHMPGAVIVPLLTGPDPRLALAVRHAEPAGVPVAAPLGPHPLLAEVLHVRLADAGLARADRIRLVGISTAADGIVVAAPGGEEAARAADATAVLLAARLAVPAIPAALEGSPTVVAAAQRLREIGASRVALSPYLVGSETDADQIASSAAEAGAEAAEPLGVHPALAQLVVERYLEALEAGVDGEPGSDA